MTSFVTNLVINTSLVAGATDSNPNKAVLLCGQRITNGVLSLSKNGLMQPNYYSPIKLPSFQSGDAALKLMSDLGLKYKMGIIFSITLPAPDHVAVASGVTQLSWDTPPTYFNSLVGFALSGNLSQSAINGDVRSAEITNGVATLYLSGQPAFVTSGNLGAIMTLSGLDNVPYPDPNESDPICLMVWDFYETYKSADTSTDGSPFAYISILSDLDSNSSPDPTPIALPKPTSVAVNADNSVSLIYQYANISELTNFGYLPTTNFGETQVKQGAVFGTYNGFTINQTASGGTAIINVQDVTGTFLDSAPVNLVLDNTSDVFTYLDGVQLHNAVLQFPVKTISDIQIKYDAFFSQVKELNKSNEILNEHYFTYGIAGNVSSLPVNAGSLPSPNYEGYILVTYPYSTKFGYIPYDNTQGNVASGRISAAVSYLLANGDTPYPALALSMINHIPTPPSDVALSTSYSAQPGGSGDVAIQQGWLPLVPIKGQSAGVQLLQSNTTLITLPGTTVPDVEFRFTHIWDCVRWLRYEVAQLFKKIIVLPNNRGRANISPLFITQFKAGILSILEQGEQKGVLENTEKYQILVKVVQNPDDPNGVAVTVPSQIIPQINSAVVDIVVFSSEYNFNTNTINQ